MNQITGHRTNVEQVIYTDGLPAVQVTHEQETTYTTSTWRQPDGSYTGGETAIRHEVTGRFTYRFPLAQPREIFGRPLVGQWSDYCLHNRDGLKKNTDESTHMNYQAWSDATHEVYSNS